eukprot:COSAG01_NODE_14669_length_1423_cov_2.117069_3_plen_64_part_01
MKRLEGRGCTRASVIWHSYHTVRCTRTLSQLLHHTAPHHTTPHRTTMDAAASAPKISDTRVADH